MFRFIWTVRLDPEAVSWLQTHFRKTELELGQPAHPGRGAVRRPRGDRLDVPHHQRLRTPPSGTP